MVKKGLFRCKKGAFSMQKRGFFPISPPVLRRWDKEFQLSPAFVRWFPMPSFENNTSAFFWGSVSFSCNSSLPDDAGCKSAFFMESASSPGRAACRNSISLLSGFVVILWRGEKSPQRPFSLYRNTLFFCFIECERHGDKVSKSGENIGRVHVLRWTFSDTLLARSGLTAYFGQWFFFEAKCFFYYFAKVWQ